MIVNVVRGDIFKSDLKHIVFAINTEGANDEGFCEVVGEKAAWHELASTGPKPLGAVISKKVGDRTFYGIAVHALVPGGWSKAPATIEKALNELPTDEVIGVVLMGGGMIGQASGADVLANLGAMARSTKKLAVYTLEHAVTWR